MKNLYKLLISYLLQLANRQLPHHDYSYLKSIFYALKKELLLKYGTKTGQAIQHIQVTCTNCDSTGTFKCHWKLPETCWSCSGTGFYRDEYNLLAEYQFGKYSFHVPEQKIFTYKPEYSKMKQIKGFVDHKIPSKNAGYEALLWLFLIYKPKVFYKTLIHIPYYRLQYSKTHWKPLLTLITIKPAIRHLKQKIKYLFTVQHVSDVFVKVSDNFVEVDVSNVDVSKVFNKGSDELPF